MIRYTDSVNRFSAKQFEGFCIGWKHPLSGDKLHKILKSSFKTVIAYDTETLSPIGFVYAISDGELSAYIPLIEVLPTYQKEGIGKELMKLILEFVEGYYMVDLCSNDKLQKFYEGLGFSSVRGMIKRNYEALN